MEAPQALSNQLRPQAIKSSMAITIMLKVAMGVFGLRINLVVIRSRSFPPGSAFCMGALEDECGGDDLGRGKKIELRSCGKCWYWGCCEVLGDDKLVLIW